MATSPAATSSAASSSAALARPRASAVLLALLAACSLQRERPGAGGGEPGAPATAAAPSSEGRAATTAHYALRVLGVETCESDGGAAPAERARRVGVALELQATGSLQVPANPYYAHLLDERGQMYEATLGGCGAALSPSLPRPGELARGYVVFDVPRTARRLTLLYAPALVGAPKEEVSIPLGP